MNLEAVRELVPPRIRIWIYGLFALAVIVVNAISAWTDGNLEWIPAANRTLEYLMVPVSVLAAVNVNVGQENDDYL